MRILLVAILGVVVLTAFVVGGRMLWRYYSPAADGGVEKRLPFPFRWSVQWNGSVLAAVVVLAALAIGVYRMTTIQEPPSNLERPPSRDAMEKVLPQPERKRNP